MEKTLYLSVSIGNTDNKLSQQEWSRFVAQIDDVLKCYGKIHFFGGASNWEPWQNVAWIVEIVPGKFGELPDIIKPIKERYKQDSIFMLFGAGLFV